MVFIYRIFYMYIFKCGLQPMNHEIAQRPDQHISVRRDLRFIDLIRED